MRRTILWLLFITSLLALFAFSFLTLTEDGTWVCTDGAWVKEGNPQGPQPETACLKPVAVPVIEAPAPLTVSVFFGNTKNDPNVLNCDISYGTSRQIVLADNGNKYLAVLAELLQGPSEAEKNLGFFTALNPDIALPQVDFTDGLLILNFAPDLEEAVGGSCRVAAIRSQIISTLKQFSEVKEVLITIDGRSEDILQP